MDKEYLAFAESLGLTTDVPDDNEDCPSVDEDNDHFKAAYGRLAEKIRRGISIKGTLIA